MIKRRNDASGLPHWFVYTARADRYGNSVFLSRT
jgi:hypothetical protein